MFAENQGLCKKPCLAPKAKPKQGMLEPAKVFLPTLSSEGQLQSAADSSWGIPLRVALNRSVVSAILHTS